MTTNISGIKDKQLDLQRKIELTKVARLEEKLKTEQEGLTRDKVNLAKSVIETGIANQALQQSQIKLNTAQVNTQLTTVGLYAAQQALTTAKADLFLKTQEDQGKLMLKQYTVADIKKSLSYQEFLHGTTPSPQLSSK